MIWWSVGMPDRGRRISGRCGVSVVVEMAGGRPMNRRYKRNWGNGFNGYSQRGGFVRGSGAFWGQIRLTVI